MIISLSFSFGIETKNTFIHARSSLENNDFRPKWTKFIPVGRLPCFRGTEWTLDIIILFKVLSRLEWTWMESEKINSKQWTGLRSSRKDHAEARTFKETALHF